MIRHSAFAVMRMWAIGTLIASSGLSPISVICASTVTGEVSSDTAALANARKILEREGIKPDPISLVTALRRRTDPEILKAAEALLVNESSKDSTQVVFEATSSESDMWRRRILAQVLARMGDERGVGLLEGMLVQARRPQDGGDTFDERRIIAATLAQLGFKSGVEELRLLLGESTSVLQTVDVARDLVRFAPSDAQSAVDGLLEGNLPPGEGLDVAKILVESGDPRGYPLVVKALASSEEGIRNRAVLLLTDYLAFEPSSVQPPIDVAKNLLAATDDQSARVRQSCLFKISEAVDKGMDAEQFVPAVERMMQTDPNAGVRAYASEVRKVLQYLTPEGKARLERLRKELRRLEDGDPKEPD